MESVLGRSNRISHRFSGRVSGVLSSSPSTAVTKERFDFEAKDRKAGARLDGVIEDDKMMDLDAPGRSHPIPSKAAASGGEPPALPAIQHRQHQLDSNPARHSLFSTGDTTAVLEGMASHIAR